jgi:hypothetical protein
MTPVAEVLRDLLRVTLLQQLPQNETIWEKYMDTGLGPGPFGALAPTTTAEMVTDGYSGKSCNRVADAIPDSALQQDPDTGTGIECSAKNSFLDVSAGASTAACLKHRRDASTCGNRLSSAGPVTQHCQHLKLYPTSKT